MTHRANAVNIESHPGPHGSQQETLALGSALGSHFDLLRESVFSDFIADDPK